MPADLHAEELAASYAALILHDSELDVKAESITALCKAAGVSVQPFWPKLFQNVFATRKVSDFLMSNVSAGAAPAAAAPAAAGGAAPAAAPAAKEAKKEEEKKEESDEDMGFGLFD